MTCRISHIRRLRRNVFPRTLPAIIAYNPTAYG